MIALRDEEVIISFCFIDVESETWKCGEVYPGSVQQIQLTFPKY